MKILVYVGYAQFQQKQCFGSELALIELLGELAQTHQISVIADNPENVSAIPDSVERIRSRAYHTRWFDVILISRYINFYLYFPIRAKKVYIWLHDIIPHPAFNGAFLPDEGAALMSNVQFDGVIVQSEWHRQTIREKYNIANNKIVTIGNGIPRYIVNSSEARIKYRMVYVSSPDRGLDYLLKVFPFIRKHFPQAELHVFRDLPAAQLSIAKTVTGVVVRGWQPNNVIFSELQKAWCWLYPTNFAETYCISALEAQLAGCFCICSNIAALSETVGDNNGVMLRSLPGSTSMLFEIIQALKTPDDVVAQKVHNAKASATLRYWDIIAQNWNRLFESGPQLYNESTKQIKPLVPAKIPTAGTGTIYLICNWCDDLLSNWAHLPGKKDRYRPWTSDVDLHAEDAVVVFNGTRAALPQTPNTLVLSMEPACNRGFIPAEWHSQYINRQNMLEWHIHPPQIVNKNKSKLLSMVVSGENRLPGHVLRLELLDLLCLSGIEFDFYGRGHIDRRTKYAQYRGELKDKTEGVAPYNFHIAFENCSEQGYFTEKLADAILCQTVCFYHGCPDIDKYIDPRAIVWLKDGTSEEWLMGISAYLENADATIRECTPFLIKEKERIIQWSIFHTLNRWENGENPFFPYPNIWVINCDHRLDRYEWYTSQLLGLPYRRFSAITKVQNHEFFGGRKERRQSYRFEYLSSGEVGCIESHVALWQKCVTSASKMCVVLEDDVLVCDNFRTKLQEAITTVRQLGDTTSCIYYLGYLDNINIYSDQPYNEHCVRMDNTVLRKHGGGTHGYIVNTKAAQQLLQCIDTYGITQPVDWFIIDSFPCIDYVLKACPLLVQQHADLPSDIQNKKE